MTARPGVSVYACLLALVWPAAALAQLQLSTVQGTVRVGSDAAPGAQVLLVDDLGQPVASTVAAADGTFSLPQVSAGRYALRAQTASLRSVTQRLEVRAGMPVHRTLHLIPLSTESVEVTSSMVSTEARVTLSGDTVRRTGGPRGTRALQTAVASTAGWSADDDGMLHFRGVDDGFLYVIDGVPVYERLDPRFGIAPDPATIGSIQILSGYVPAEYGLRSGGVIEVRSTAPTSVGRWGGSLDMSGGSDGERSGAALLQGRVGDRAGLILSGSGERSQRFLDPVDLENLHNEGRVGSGHAEYLWSGTRDVLAVRAGAGRSRFEVPHGDEAEALGQDQEQIVRQSGVSASWQRSWSSRTTSQWSAYARDVDSRLEPGELDAPLRAETRQQQRRIGLLGALTHERGRHRVKVGFEAAHVALDETFRFHVTDDDRAVEKDLSDEARHFTPDKPFVFAGETGRTQYSVYAQDTWKATRRLTLDFGLRFDQTRLLLREQQLSPRLGLAFTPDQGRTTFRGAANRLYQPPQTEYLMLASSAEARALSPFTEQGGGADVHAERQTSFEVAVERQMGGLKLTLAAWHRRIANQADPNVFFGTTIVFPNSVATGRARGFDVRLDWPRRNRWSGFVSYSLSRITQFGPINGGLFLEEEILEIGPGTEFTPDHDRRHVAAAALSYDDAARGASLTVSARYQSGSPLEVEEDDLDELQERPGAELVDFERERVKPALTVDVLAAGRLVRRGRAEIGLRAAVYNLFDERYAYNFGNPFSGTHFGRERSGHVGLRLSMQ
jgi:outer membrane receptor protein involved in Fe transport